MSRLLYIACFGVLGIFSRYFLGLAIPKFLAPPFPYATFIINVTGAFLIGVIQVIGAEKNLISADMRIGILVGFLGGYTTFSSYCLEAVRLAEESEYGYMLAYFLISPVLGYAAAFGGMLLARSVFGGGTA
jgi:CrcB protein